MKKLHKKTVARVRRARRTRQVLRGTKDRPRLSVFRSNRHVSAQLIDDIEGSTLASASDLDVSKNKPKKAKTGLADRAKLVGERLAEAAKAKGIRKVKFDRGPYRFHGLVKALAEGAKKSGLSF